VHSNICTNGSQLALQFHFSPQIYIGKLWGVVELSIGHSSGTRLAIVSNYSETQRSNRQADSLCKQTQQGSEHRQKSNPRNRYKTGGECSELQCNTTRLCQEL